MEKKSNKKQILEKQLELRRRLWPEITDDDLWSHKQRDGFIPVPRVLPLILQIMDDLAKTPVSSTYLDLWCRKFDEQFLIMSRSQTEYAFYAGYSGQRAEQTWKERMRKLKTLGFIKTHEGPNREFSYVLIVNPLKVIARHIAAKSPGLRQAYINALEERSNQVKANQMGDGQAVPQLVIGTNLIKP